MVTPEQRVVVLQAEVEAFKTYLSSLPAEAWNQPSACVGWTVADVVAHLNGQDFASRVTRGLGGDASPPDAGKHRISPPASLPLPPANTRCG